MAKKLTALLLIFVACLAGSGCTADAPAGSAGTQRVEIAGRTFELELALDSAARYQGLSDRPSIPEDGGMLFVFPHPRELTFVMRRCLVPIDLIFLAPNGRVVSMHQMPIEPYDTSEWRLKKYSSGWPAQFAIELRGGTLDELALEPGQKVELPLEALKRRAE